MPFHKITKIYLDMDGVIADFNTEYIRQHGIHPRQAEKEKKFEPYFRQMIEAGGFEKLPLMHDAHLGLDYLKRIPITTEILSSTAREEVHNVIQGQKIRWLKKHNIDFNPILVPGKRYKKEYARPDTLLIDDTEVNIKQFREAGGHAIYHKDWVTTLAILKLYV
jgi:hypothetical protein